MHRSLARPRAGMGTRWSLPAAMHATLPTRQCACTGSCRALARRKCRRCERCRGCTRSIAWRGSALASARSPLRAPSGTHRRWRAFRAATGSETTASVGTPNIATFCTPGRRPPGTSTTCTTPAHRHPHPHPDTRTDSPPPPALAAAALPPSHSPHHRTVRSERGGKPYRPSRGQRHRRFRSRRRSRQTHATAAAAATGTKSVLQLTPTG
mmetsp:Transcript_11958/g.30738  ORF Transcript_11958/g.30738 Transcript_11958/m.30738 type:complete len:210 (+) Transcript_11958:287-916(+)